MSLASSLEKHYKKQKDQKIANDKRLEDYNQGIMPTKVTTSGTEAERSGELAGLERAQLGYGQNLGQTGQDIQRIKELQQGRTSQSGADPVSAAIMGQKQGALANAQRGMSASGVKGGTAQGVMSDVEKEQNQNIAASLYGQQRQSIADERSLASNMLAGTEAMSQGGKATGTAENMPKAPDTGGMSVICTELHRQGIMSLELYLMDTNYGIALSLRKPHVIVGYQFWGRPVARLMAKSPIFAKLISIPAMAWARNMAGDKNLLGAFISFVGEPVCEIIGKIKLSFLGAKYV
jgi:hypothetical protein